jgi:hypothetical protein
VNVKDEVKAWIVGILYVAILFVLVRPGSAGPTFITTVSTAIANVVKAATGGTPSASGTSTTVTAV